MDKPNTYTLKFATSAWASLNRRRAGPLEAKVNQLSILRQVERLTFAEIKGKGAPLGANGGSTSAFPDTPDLRNPSCYVLSRISGSVERDFARLLGGAYRKSLCRDQAVNMEKQHK